MLLHATLIPIPDQSDINTLVLRDESSDSEVEEVAAIEPASSEQMREMDNIVNAMRGDVNAPCFTQSSGKVPTIKNVF